MEAGASDVCDYAVFILARRRSVVKFDCHGNKYFFFQNILIGILFQMTNLFSACILSLSSKDNLLIESHRSCENLFSISTLHHFQHNPERVFKLSVSATMRPGFILMASENIMICVQVFSHSVLVSLCGKSRALQV